MKMKILGCISALIIALIAAINVNVVPNKELAEISFANIEAFANMSQTLDCWETVDWQGGSSTTHKTYCGDCAAILCTSWTGKSTCSS